jgi:hypothetical protein
MIANHIRQFPDPIVAPWQPHHCLLKSKLPEMNQCPTMETQQTEKPPNTSKMPSDEAEHNDSHQDDMLTEERFASLGVVEPICLAADKLGWKSASRIQAQVLPHALEGKDVIGLAETGMSLLCSCWFDEWLAQLKAG